jgi:hypothetical protein
MPSPCDAAARFKMSPVVNAGFGTERHRETAVAEQQALLSAATFARRTSRLLRIAV